MDKEIIKDWLNDIATPTGISYSGDRTISESMVEEIVDYVDDLEQQCKKQKEVIDKAIELLGNYKHYSTPDEKQNGDNEDLVNNAFNTLKEVSE